MAAPRGYEDIFEPDGGGGPLPESQAVSNGGSVPAGYEDIFQPQGSPTVPRNLPRKIADTIGSIPGMGVYHKAMEVLGLPKRGVDYLAKQAGLESAGQLYSEPGAAGTILKHVTGLPVPEDFTIEGNRAREKRAIDSLAVEHPDVARLASSATRFTHKIATGLGDLGTDPVMLAAALASGGTSAAATVAHAAGRAFIPAMVEGFFGSTAAAEEAYDKGDETGPRKITPEAAEHAADAATNAAFLGMSAFDALRKPRAIEAGGPALLGPGPTRGELSPGPAPIEPEVMPPDAGAPGPEPVPPMGNYDQIRFAHNWARWKAAQDAWLARGLPAAGESGYVPPEGLPAAPPRQIEAAPLDRLAASVEAAAAGPPGPPRLGPKPPTPVDLGQEGLTGSPAAQAAAQQMGATLPQTPFRPRAPEVSQAPPGYEDIFQPSEAPPPPATLPAPPPAEAGAISAPLRGEPGSTAVQAEPQRRIESTAAAPFAEPTTNVPRDALENPVSGGTLETLPPEPKVEQPTSQAVARAGAEAAPEPTGPQKLAGNFQKGHVRWGGMDLSIENPKGGPREAADKSWRVEKMPAHYGYIRGSEGADGDHVDFYMGPKPASPKVWVVDQVDADTGAFDEHKALLGFPDEQTAIDTYKRGFTDGKGPQRVGAVTGMSVGQFRKWVKSAEHTKGPISDTVPMPEPEPAEPRSAYDPRRYPVSPDQAKHAESIASSFDKDGRTEADLTEDHVRQLGVPEEDVETVTLDAKRRMAALEAGREFIRSAQRRYGDVAPNAPHANGVEVIPTDAQKGHYWFVQRHQGRVVGAAKSLFGIRGMVAGGPKVGSPVSARELYARMNEQGIEPSDALSPYGRAAQERYRGRASRISEAQGGGVEAPAVPARLEGREGALREPPERPEPTPEQPTAAVKAAKRPSRRPEPPAELNQVLSDIEAMPDDGLPEFYNEAGRRRSVPELQALEAAGRVPRGTVQRFEDWWSETGAQAAAGKRIGGEDTEGQSVGALYGITYKGRPATRSEILKGSPAIHKRLLEKVRADKRDQEQGHINDWLSDLTDEQFDAVKKYLKKRRVEDLVSADVEQLTGMLARREKRGRPRTVTAGEEGDVRRTGGGAPATAGGGREGDVEGGRGAPRQRDVPGPADSEGEGGRVEARRQAYDAAGQLALDFGRPGSQRALQSVSGGKTLRGIDAGSGVRTVGLTVTIPKELKTRGWIDLRGRRVDRPSDLAVLAQVYRDPRYETFRLFYTKDGKIVAHEGITSRVPDTVRVFDPKRLERDLHAIRERMRRTGADGYWMLHNHPSGQPKASNADVAITRATAAAVPGFKGHVIIDGDSYGTINISRPADGLWRGRAQAAPDYEASIHSLPKDLVNVEPYFKPTRVEESVPNEHLEAAGIRSPIDLAKLGHALRTGAPAEYVTLIHTDSQGFTRAVQEMPLRLFDNRQNAGDYIRGQRRAVGASRSFAYHPGGPEFGLFSSARHLVRDGALDDAIIGRSASDALSRQGIESIAPRKIPASYRVAEEKKPIYEKTKLGDQALMPGALQAATKMRKRTEGREAEGPLFTQDKDKAERELEAKEKKAQGSLFEEKAPYGKKEPAPPFYSHLERVAQKIPQAMSGADLQRYLAGKGVKAEEMKWTGLDDFLKDKGKVTPQELREFVAANKVDVQEVTLGGKDPKLMAQMDALQERAEQQNVRSEQAFTKFVDALENGGIGRLRAADLAHQYRMNTISPAKALEVDEALGIVGPDGPPSGGITSVFKGSGIRNAAIDQWRKFQEINREWSALREQDFNKSRGTKFSQWQLPGGENYRELLLTLPKVKTSDQIVPDQAAREKYQAAWDALAREHDENYSGTLSLSDERARDELENKMDQLHQKMVQETALRMPRQRSGDFSRGHYAEPNVLAHVRFNDRIDADGKRVLFLEEVQSDWAQKGRREGFKEGYEARFNALRDEITQKRGMSLVDLRLRARTSIEAKNDIAAIDSAYALAQAEKHGDMVPTAPFVGKTEAWTELAMKRMLRYAAEHGYDKLAWTTGEQQAARYDLSKQADHVRAFRRKDGKYDLTVRPKGPRGNDHDISGLAEKALEDNVGKDLAEKIVAQPDGWQTYEGLDLKVGGAGMKGFYDKIVPAVAGKLGKKWGAKVGETAIRNHQSLRPEQLAPEPRGETGQWIIYDPVTGEGWMDPVTTDSPTFRSAGEAQAVINGMGKSAGLPVHSMDITPEMRASATGEGFSTFEEKKPYGKAEPEKEDYRGEHAAPDRETGSPGYNLQKAGTYPDDVYTHGAQHYGDGTPLDATSFAIVRGLRGRPRATVTVYRAVPHEPIKAERIRSLEKEKDAILRRGGEPGRYDKIIDEIEKLRAAPDAPQERLGINPGDWVTINRQYAKDHGEGALQGKYRLVSKTVRAEEIFTNGDSIHEWGYDPTQRAPEDALPAREQAAAAGGAPPKEPPVEPKQESFFFDGDEALNRLRKAGGGKAFDLGGAAAAGGGVLRDVTIYGASVLEKMARAAAGAIPRFGPWAKAFVSGLKGLVKGLADRLQSLYRQAVGLYKTRSAPKATAAAGAAAPPPQAAGPAPKAPSRAPGTFSVPEETMLQHVQRLVQDRLNRLGTWEQTVREQGGAVRDKIKDLFDAASPIAAERIQEARRQYVDPLVEHLSKSKLSIKDLNQYVYAKHAPTRNAVIAQRWDGKVLDGSGMSDAKAASILADFQKRGLTPALEKGAELVRKIREEQLRVLLDGGLLSKEEAAGWTRTFGKDYVPLKTAEVDEGMGTGQGFDIRGKESKAAGGRASPADNPVAALIQQLDRAIIRAEKNKADQAFGQFAEENGLFKKNKEHWRVEVRDGKARVVPDSLRAAEDFFYKVNGEKVRLDVQSVDPILDRALKNLSAKETGKLVETIGKFTRFYSQLVTSWNPEFPLTNLTRDIQTILANTTAENSAKIARSVLKNIPAAMKGMYEALKDPTGTSAWQRTAKEFRENGGSTGWFSLKDMASIENEMANAVKRAGPGQAVLRGLVGFRDLIERVNKAGEGGARLAYFKALRDHGVSARDAATAARGISIDFTKKGELGPITNSLYAFFNANVQGAARLGQVLSTKRGAAVAGGIAGIGLALDLYNRSVAVDSDEDGENDYDSIPGYVKDRNLVIMRGEGKNPILFPMPYGYNVIEGVGRQAGALLSGATTPSRAGMEVVSSLWNAFNPLGSEADLVQTLSPTFLDPVVQDVMNRDFTGKPIRPEHGGANAKPSSELYFKNVNPVTRDLAKWLNSATGGDRVTPGYVSISPETIEHYAGFATGGLGKFGANIVGTTESLAAGEVPSIRNVPLVRRFAYEKREGLTISETTRDKYRTAFGSDALRHALGEAGYLPELPQRTITVPGTMGKQVDLTQQEYQVFVKEDEKMAERLDKLVGDYRYLRMSDDAKRAFIQKRFQLASENARKRVLRDAVRRYHELQAGA